MPFEIITLKTAGLVLRPITISISSAMDEAARSFETKVKQPGLSQTALLRALRNSPPVTIHAAASDGVAFGQDMVGDLILTGHVEKGSPRLAESVAEMAVSGRSMTGDVVDSSAEHETGEFRDKDAVDIFTPLAG